MQQDIGWPSIVICLLILVGLYLMGRGLRQVRRGRLLSAAVRLCPGLACLVVGACVSGLLINLLSYQRLTYETIIASIELRRLEAKHYQATLILADGDRQIYELYGDEWQLDARVLKWHGLANLAGLNSRYRLERLSGRYHDVVDERTESRTVYTLVEEYGLQVWPYANALGLKLVDATYGSANYLPMAHDARFTVSLGQSGLITRPANEAAEDAIRAW